MRTETEVDTRLHTTSFTPDFPLWLSEKAEMSDPRTPKNPLLMSFDSVVTSTPMGANSSNMSNLAARMSMAMNSGGGRAKMSAQDMQPSPAASIDTTPKMLGLRASSTTGDGGNPYLTVWHSQQRTTTTPKTTARINGLGSTSSRSRHATSPGFGSGLSVGLFHFKCWHSCRAGSKNRSAQ
uniref:Uncharacterized protein n=1 Tax=Plectus sambesii TaxID=2011161 RepID=A0A914VWS9_9BILA